MTYSVGIGKSSSETAQSRGNINRGVIDVIDTLNKQLYFQQNSVAFAWPNVSFRWHSQAKHGRRLGATKTFLDLRLPARSLRLVSSSFATSNPPTKRFMMCVVFCVLCCGQFVHTSSFTMEEVEKQRAIFLATFICTMCICSWHSIFWGERERADAPM